MNNQKRFVLGKEPYIRKADRKDYGTDKMMKDLVIALIPLILFSFVKNGLLPFINHDTTSVFDMLYPLILVIMGGASCFLIEYLYYKFLLKEKNAIVKVHDSFAMISGIILAMICPLKTPLWLLIIGCLVATVIGKLLFGGFGHNIFNPALIGYLFISVAYYGVIKGGFANPSEVEILAGATPLSVFSNNKVASLDVLIKPYGNLWNFFLGFIPGSLAETSSLLCIISCGYLIYKKVITWRIPVFYIGTVAVLTYIIGAFNGYALDFRYTLFHLFSGGLMFGAVFMATEPVTNPKTPEAKTMWAIGLGVLTVFLRFKGQLAEGVATSILTMNLFTLVIDKVCAKARVADKKKDSLIPYIVMFTLFIGISCYAIFSTKPTVVLDESKQDIVQFTDDSKNEYIYNIDIGGYNVEVITDKTDNIISINKEKFDNEEYKNKIEDLIKKTNLRGERNE